MSRIRILATSAITAAVAAIGLLTVAPAAGAHPASAQAHSRVGISKLGGTTVTTAPGIAGTLIKAGVLPLPVIPRTGFAVSFRNSLQASYTFPITGNTADLSTGTGDITHAGGIAFVSGKASLEIGRFDIDLAAGKVFATQVNFKPGRVAVLDLDLSGLSVTTGPDGSTILSGISVNLDAAAAGALNATFGLNLPADGSLGFGTARVVIK